MVTLTCDNKGCFKTTFDSLLNEETNEVICSECGKPIKGVSDFTKRMMFGNGKIIKKRAYSAYSVKCAACETNGQPKISEGDELVCFKCGEKLNLTKQFETMFREYMKNEKK